MKIAVVGGGSWGTTVAHLCAHNSPTTLWARNYADVNSINERNENLRYLPGHQLHEDLRATSDIADAVANADVIVMGVPSHAFDETLNSLVGLVSSNTPLVSLTKGFEAGSGQRMTELIRRHFPKNPAGVLTGPNLAKEILSGHAAASVISLDDIDLARNIRPYFTTERFRVYTNPDVIGCELGGALKNVIAVAVGMADGLGAGDNTRAAVITRGLAEVTRLGVALGGKPETFSGLAGMGDLVATCISSQSRNRSVGEQLGKGQPLDSIIAEMDQVAEGIKSAPVVARLGREAGVDLPICEEICAVVEEGRTAQEVYRGLLRRPQQGEVNRSERSSNSANRQ